MFNFAKTFLKHPEPDMAEGYSDSKDRGVYSLSAAASAMGGDQISEADYQQFFAMSQNILLVLDEGGVIVQKNASLPACFETGTPFLSIFHEEDRPSIRNSLQMMRMSDEDMGQEPAVQFEARLALADQDRWFVWSVRGAGDRSYVLGEDVTSIREEQSNVNRYMNQLGQAESIGRFGRWHWVIGDQEMSWSDELYRIFNVGKDFVPSFDNVYELIHEDDRNRMEQTLQRAVINENEFDIDFCVISPDGQQRYLRCEGRCGLDHTGEATALYGLMQDMTERILYEHDLRAAKEAAEQAYAAKSQFLANMSHELRTPLNAIIGFSEMIESQIFGPAGNEKYVEYGTNIKQSGAHLLDLIGDILDMSKIEAGKYELDLEEVTLAPLVKSAVQMIGTRAADKNIAVNIISAFEDDMMIVADRRACLQVMLNILSNAVKFTGENGQIDVSCSARGDGVRMKFSDNGIGIPANKIELITKPFEQVDVHYAREHEGSGLGLAITKELIELHGGSLVIESQVGAGTDVTVSLPLKPAAQS